LTRNNVEALEPRVLLSAHGADLLHGPGPDDTTAPAQLIAPAQGNTEQQNPALDQITSNNSTADSGPLDSSQIDSGPVDPSQNDSPEAQPRFNFGPDPIVPFPTDSSSNSSGNQTSDSNTQQSDPAPSSTGQWTFHFGGWTWAHWGSNDTGNSDTSTGSGNNTGSGSTTGSDGITVVEIIFIDPIPTGSWPIVSHPLNNGWNDGDNNPPASTVSNGGTQQQPQQYGSTGTGTAKSPVPSTNQSNPPTQGSQNESDASDSHDSNLHAFVQRGPGTPAPIYDPTGAGEAQSEIARPSTPIPALSPAFPAAKPAAATPDATPVTPLAMTPGHESAASALTTSSSSAPFSIVPVAASHDSPTMTRTATPDGIPSMHMPSQLAASLPPAGALVKAIDAAVPAAARAVTQQVQTAGAVVASVEAVTADAIQQSLPAQATYNFIRFDAASFHDAVAAFANDLASMTNRSASHHSTTRAWIITGTVLGMDAIFLGYWRRQVQKQRKARLALAKRKA
jgi:hypothetical protein